MPAREQYNATYLNEAFLYRPEDGSLIWRERPVHHFKSKANQQMWNKKFSGGVAGCLVENNGRPAKCNISLLGRHVKAHRIIWEMHHGPIPEGIGIDHINGDPWDNRLVNLRLATSAQNNHNARIKNNSSRIKGAFLDKRRNTWFSAIMIHGTLKYIGSFKTKGEAGLAYAKESLRLHGRFSYYYRNAA